MVEIRNELSALKVQCSEILPLKQEVLKLREEIGNMPKEILELRQELTLSKEKVLESQSSSLQNLPPPSSSTYAAKLSKYAPNTTKQVTVIDKTQTADARDDSRVQPPPPAQRQSRSDATNDGATKLARPIGNIEEGWSTVRNSKRKSFTEVKKGGNREISQIKGTEKNKYLHVWKLRKSTTEKELFDYVRSLNIIQGDFKVHKVKTKTERDYGSFLLTVPESSYDKLCDPMSNRLTNCNNHMLDLVLCSGGLGECVSVGEGAPLVPVDPQHPPLEVTVRAPPAAAQRPPPPLATRSPSDLDDCVPRKKRPLVNSRYSYPEWYTPDIIRDIKLKAKLHKRYKTSKSTCDYEAFARCRAKVKEMIESAYNEYRHRVEKHLTEDPKAFWNYVKSKRGSRNRTKIVKDGIVLAEEQCADEFARYFHSVYKTENPNLDVEAAVAAAGGGNAAARVQLQRLQRRDVCAALARLPPKRSAGPDGIPAFLFKDCSYALSDPLLHIYNVCLQRMEYPEKWKLSRVIPVPKGAASSSVDGYRPVAVLSTPAKVFESAVQKSLLVQVQSQLSDVQHGFRPGHSTTSNLLNYMCQVLPEVDGGGQVDAAYFDFRKAFDLVDNDVLLSKLASVGCTPHLLQFFASYMRNRRQYVEYGSHQSEPYFTRSGVSQGSNLGPLEFILMINDLPSVVRNASCLLFADDLKLFLPIRDATDCIRLQQDIDRVVEWSLENKLQFNTAKCLIITFSRARPPLHHGYAVENVPMKRVTEVRDLGVHLTAELTFRDHITNICKKAFRNLGFVLRQVQGFININAIVALYNALVRSNLEFNAVIWAPHEMKYHLMLERIQNKFIRFLYLRQYGVYPFYPLMYPTQFILGMVGYNELRVRREVTLLCYIFKIMNGKLSNSEVLSRIGMNVPDRYVERRRRPRLLAAPAARTHLLGRAPLTRALHTLNIIAEHIDLFSCSLSEFTRTALYTKHTETISSLQTTIHSLEDQLNSQEQFNLRNEIEICGLLETEKNKKNMPYCGFIPNAQLIFRSNSQAVDYQNDMNKANFNYVFVNVIYHRFKLPFHLVH
ncbi:unnamed protein product [Plutella xylostella]|uniref:(diamondback moth) hypothetical protein n=1 Tax=Plutella xylostella TaxID=51655 RepID=A0A8S4FK20_PLUXY|nr:unnamed protein product [Plutella xylostella]